MYSIGFSLPKNMASLLSGLIDLIVCFDKAVSIGLTIRGSTDDITILTSSSAEPSSFLSSAIWGEGGVLPEIPEDGRRRRRRKAFYVVHAELLVPAGR